MSGTENATAAIAANEISPGIFQYTITLTDTGTTTIGTFWFAWDDVPDQDFMSALPTSVGSPSGWTAFVTQHQYGASIGYGIEWIATSTNARLNPNGSSSAFTFTSTETPTQLAAVSPFDNTFQTTSSFVYQGGAFATSGGIIVATVACFREGTRIATPHGEVPVETLAAGDLVLTPAGEARPVRWAGHRRIDCGQVAHPARVWPVRIGEGALNPGVPRADVFLSPDHAVCIDGMLIPVRHLINGVTIVQVAVETVVYHHLELDRHDLVLANGMPAESYLDTGDRGKFDNRDPRGASPEEATAARFVAEAMSHLPLMVTGPRVDAIRRRLARRAGTEAAPSGRTAALESLVPETLCG